MQKINVFMYNLRKSGAGGTFRILRQTLLKNRRKSHKVKVCFFYQDKAVWDKSRPVYEAMKNDERFETFILIIPNRDLQISEEQYREISEHENVICAQKPGSGEWFDLQKEKPDFIFLAKPYAILLPEGYWEGRLSGFTRLCYIPYGYQNWVLPIGLEKDFFRSIALFFADDSYSKTEIVKQFPISSRLGIRKIFDFGYPSLASICTGKGMKDTPFWNEQEYKFKVMWTPRWTMDDECGGTHFFEYKDFFLHYFDLMPEASLVFRPHPLAFHNWVETGQMTQKEVDEYLRYYEEHSNMYYDTCETYNATFWKSDVLVTDFSSIIVEYFVTKKPVIYCSKDLTIFNSYIRNIMNGCYLVSSEEELKKVLDGLKNGYDPLREKRHQLVDSLLAKHTEDTVNNIINAVWEAR